MMPRYAHLLALVALAMLVASGPAFAQTDYDMNNDGYIDVANLAQLNAMRWDLNGDGAIDASATTSDTTAYNAAFPNRVTTSSGRMGCPSGTCTGYELLNNLNFDENSDGEITSADATYWNDGDGWVPIGTDAARYTGDFKGNGYTIDNLTINRPAVSGVGLFGTTDTASRIESVGVTNASVAGSGYAGALVGALRGTVVACYSTGNVSATTRVAGGLVGWTPNAITSSYSTASVSGPEHVGGLLGASQGGSVTNSYSIGTVIGTGSSPLIGGLIGSGTGGTASYWDTQTSGCTSGGTNGCTTSAGGSGVTGQTTSALQSPTDYTLIFSTWNANIDGQPGDDDPWTFGAADQYPVLKYAGMDTTVQYNLQPPGRPTSVTVTPKADTLDVRWTAASYATGYKVQWKSGDQSYAASREETVTGTRYKIANLLGETTYTVRVIATKTGAPDGTPSAEQTGVPALLGSPAVMVAAKVDTLTVTWNVVSNATGYKVQWKSGVATYPTSDEQSATHGQATIAGGGTTIHKISGLTTGTTYTIRVIATSTNINLADSVPSDAVMVTLATTRPTNVRVTPGPAQLIVAWTEATGATGYKVQWRSGGQSYNTSDRQETVSGGSTTTYTIENLTFGTTYTVRVTATLAGGTDSTPSDEVMGTPYAINYDSDGDGLIDIKTLAQLHAIRWDLNGDGVVADNDTMNYNAAFPNRVTTSSGRMGCPSGTCTGYELLNNLNFDENNDNEITVADATYWNSGAGWAPIGNSATKYTGTFHGNDYTISNLFINRSADDIGLFGFAADGTIRNLSLVNANVTGNSETAVLVGEGNRLHLMHIRVTGQVSGYARSGGLVGWLRHGSSTITACRSEVDVTGSNISIGGLVGWSRGTITASYATGAVSGTTYVGGLVGFHGNFGSPKAIIRASYATGVVSGNYRTGGLVGANFYSSTITGSYAIGPVSAPSQVGGLVGLNSSSTITHSYYDSTTSKRSDTGRGAPQTTAGLQGPTGYTGIYIMNWDLNLDRQPGGDDPWTFGKTDQYPVLKYAGMDTTAQFAMQPPGIPTSVTVTQKADTLDVRWTAASYATGYKVQWKSGTQSYDTASREATTTGTRHKIPNLTFGTTYTVRVIATKTGARDGTPSAEQSIFIVSTLDSPPVMASAKVDTLTVTWNAVSNATGYRVQWKSGVATYPTSDLTSAATHGQATIAGGSTTTYKISNVTAGTTYTIRVIATSTNLNIADSDPSEEVMVTAATNKPTNVRVTPGHFQLLVAWTEATGATGYKIQWKSGQQAYNTSDRQETVSGGSTTTYTIENLTFGTTYTVRVTATLAGGTDSTPSDEVMGTPQGIDYDGDGDGLIDIETLAQLHAIRWDLNGDGAIDASASTSDTTAYNAAFPNRDITSNVRMGCPSGTCTGYELLNNLDFDENGDGEITSADATYWNNGDGWLPIGTNAARYTGDFKGNGYTIDNLTINRPAVVEVGLFGNADTASRIESVGITNASVAGGEYAGALVGALRGTVVACYSTGSVSATTRTAGGLVGWTPNAITSSYSTASVSGPEHVGGLLGASQGGTVTNSYSIGTVIGTGSSPLVGGLIGSGTGGTASYWDTQTSGCTSGGSNGCTTSAGGSGVTGQTTSALQSPTGYTLIFSTWNANLDGQPGNDEPWTFGKTDQYPVLKYAGMDTTVQYNLQPPGIPTSVTVTPKVDTLGCALACVELCDGVQGAVEIRRSELRRLASGDRHGDALQDPQLARRDDLHSACHCHQDRCAR